MHSEQFQKYNVDQQSKWEYANKQVWDINIDPQSEDDRALNRIPA